MAATIVLGAGIAGLAAASNLSSNGGDVLVLEQSRKVGGLATTDDIDGFRFDQTGHFLHLRSSLANEYFRSLGVPLLEMRRSAGIMLNGRGVPYPIQYNLWALEADLRNRIFESLQTAAQSKTPKPLSFDQALRETWGDELMRVFFQPYHEKLWARSLQQLPSDCLGKYAVQLDLALIEAGVSSQVNYPGYNATFYYPASGRIEAITQAMAIPFKERVVLEAKIVKIDPVKRICFLQNGDSYQYTNLISTIPLPTLLELICMPMIPKRFLECAAVNNIRVGFRGRTLVPYHWAYLPDPEMPGFRVGFPTNVASTNAPDGCSSISFEQGVPDNRSDNSDLRRNAMQALRILKKAGWVDVEDIVVLYEKLICPAYVVYRSEDRNIFRQARDRLRQLGIHLAGRFGVWDYYSMEDAFLSGFAAANEIRGSHNKCNLGGERGSVA